MREAFENPANGHVELMPRLPWLKALLAGPLFFALRGAWAHALIAFPLWIGGWGVITLALVAVLSVLGVSEGAGPKRPPVSLGGEWLLILGAAIHASLARRIVRKAYLRRGWRAVGARPQPGHVQLSARRIEPTL